MQGATVVVYVDEGFFSFSTLAKECFTRWLKRKHDARTKNQRLTNVSVQKYAESVERAIRVWLTQQLPGDVTQCTARDVLSLWQTRRSVEEHYRHSIQLFIEFLGEYVGEAPRKVDIVSRKRPRPSEIPQSEGPCRVPALVVPGGLPVDLQEDFCAWLRDEHPGFNPMVVTGVVRGLLWRMQRMLRSGPALSGRSVLEMWKAHNARLRGLVASTGTQAWELFLTFLHEDPEVRAQKRLERAMQASNNYFYRDTSAVRAPHPPRPPQPPHQQRQEAAEEPHVIDLCDSPPPGTPEHRQGSPRPSSEEDAGPAVPLSPTQTVEPSESSDYVTETAHVGIYLGVTVGLHIFGSCPSLASLLSTPLLWPGLSQPAASEGASVYTEVKVAETNNHLSG